MGGLVNFDMLEHTNASQFSALLKIQGPPSRNKHVVAVINIDNSNTSVHIRTGALRGVVISAIARFTTLGGGLRKCYQAKSVEETLVVS